MSTSAPIDEEAFARLVRWIEQAGGMAAPLRLGPSATGGRGVLACARIAPGERVLAVPERLLVTIEAARASEIGRRIEASGVEVRSPHTWLAAHLLHERRSRASPWQPYLDTLPESFPSVPLLFDDRRLELLRGSFTIERIRARKEALAGEYERLAGHVPELREVGYDAFVWARIAVVSRVFAVTVAGRKTEALVPLADLLNHELPRATGWGFDDGERAFTMTALQDLAPGVEVHDSYGKKCNSRFFVSYGFALPDNEDNRAEIRLPSPEGEVVFDLPARFTRETRRALSHLRAVAAGQRPGEVPVTPISRANEQEALGAFAAACKEAIGRFGTTIAEDDAILRGADLPPDERLCVLVRRGEKRVLRDLVDFAHTAIHMLDMEREVALRARMATPPAAGRFDDYIQSVVLRLVR